MNAPNLIIPGTIPQAIQWNWETRSRAWIFGMGPELLLGRSGPVITDGESYEVYQVFAPGVEIEEGEALRSQKQSEACAEFHHTMEMTLQDLTNTCRVDPKRGCPRYAFWIEPRGRGTDEWRTVFVASKGVAVQDLQALRGKLAHPSRSKLMVAIKSFRMKVFRDEVNKGG